MKGVSELRPHSAVSLLTPLKSFAPLHNFGLKTTKGLPAFINIIHVMSLNWRAVILKGFMLAAGHQQLLFYKQDSEEIKETLFYKESLSVLVWPLFGSVALTLETVSKVTKTGKYSGGFGLKRSVLPPPGSWWRIKTELKAVDILPGFSRFPNTTSNECKCCCASVRCVNRQLFANPLTPHCSN